MNITMLGSGSVKSTLSFRMVQLSKELSRGGWKVTAILPGSDKYNDFTTDRTARIPGVKLRQPWQLRTENQMVGLLPYLITAAWHLLRSRPDAVYIYKPTPITIIGLLPKLLSRTPIILDLDDLGSEVMKRQGQGKLQVRLVSWCERLAMKYADAVVAASTFLESIVQDKYPAKPVLVLPNGVDTAQYIEPAIGPARQHVYYFGAVDNLDLIDGLLRAAPLVVKAMPETRFTIIGGGRALPAAKTLATALGVKPYVAFTGWTDMFAAQRYTRFADIAVCYQPDTRTVRAASNMKVFQYMAMGAVPVVSRVGDLAEYVRQGRAGAVVRPDDPKALAAALISLLERPADRRRLAETARRLAETDYAWQTLGEQLADFARPLVQEMAHA